MWYKYLNRTTDQLRLFRYGNLKFLSDEFGLTRNQAISNTKDLLLRFGRTEGMIRGFNFWFTFGSIQVILYLKKTFIDPEKKAKEEADAKANDLEGIKNMKQKLFVNNLGAPTRPTRSFEDVSMFLASSLTINRASDYITYCLPLNDDQIQGLDSPSTENDEQMIDLFKESERRKGH